MIYGTSGFVVGLGAGLLVTLLTWILRLSKGIAGSSSPKLRNLLQIVISPSGVEHRLQNG